MERGPRNGTGTGVREVGGAPISGVALTIMLALMVIVLRGGKKHILLSDLN